MFAGNTADASGGAVRYNVGCSVEVTDCNFTDNSASEDGGGLHLDPNCTGTITDGLFVQNDANQDGGAIYLNGCYDLTVADCNIAYNTAIRGGGIYGIYSPDSRIIGCSISHNEASRAYTEYFLLDPNDPNALPVPIPPDDPAVDANDPNLIVTERVDRSVVAQGGGIFCFAGPGLIADCDINYNVANTSGGGLYLAAGEYDLTTLKNCLVTNNSAGRDGGGLSANWQVKVKVSNCTIADNVLTNIPAYGGGLYTSYGSYVHVIDSIIWGNISNHEGMQIAVGSGDVPYPIPSRVNVTYSGIESGVDPNAPGLATAVDFVFCVDSSYSMDANVAAIKFSASEIVDAIASSMPDFRIAVVDYRDFNDPNLGYGVTSDYPYQTDSQFTNNVAAAVAGIGAIRSGEQGGDWPDSVYAALMHCIDHSSLMAVLGGRLHGADASSLGPGPWRSGKVNRVIMLIGDAPPHAPEPFTQYTLDDIVAAATGLPTPRRIFTIPIGGDSTTVGYFRRLAQGTGGAMIEAADASSVVDAIMETIAAIPRTPSMIYVEQGSKLDGWDAGTNMWAPDNRNVTADPRLVAGYYLSQIASGELIDSPCVDAGSADANDPNIALDTYTTRTDGVPDANIVDMGYHYERGLTQYQLTVTVLEDPNDPGIHGYVDPNRAVVYEGFGSNVVTLTAHPDPGYKVKRWTGTNDDTSTSRINTVTVTADTLVTIEFEPAPLYNFMAVVIDRGTGPHGVIEPNSGSFYDGETIALRAIPDPNYEVKMWYGTDDDSSKDPNNTVTVSGTDVIVAVEFGLIGQNIINLFDENGVLDRRSPFDTIQAAIDAADDNYEVVLSDGIYTGDGNYNLNLSAGVGPNDVRPITVRSQDGPANCIIDCQGLGRAFIFDSNEDPNYIVDGLTITGGAADFGGAILCDNSSPTIINCRIMNSIANGNGGGIYCANSSPRIVNTEITYNTAGGFGGGIYCEAESTAEIINCLIAFNTSGDIGGSIYLYESDATITLCTVAYNYGLDYGDLQFYPNPKGGICCRDSDPAISNCIIGRNGGTYIWGMWGDPYSAGDDLYECEATYSCIENGDQGDGNIDDDPLWVAGPLGDFYLSQIQAGQAATSPCVNAGEQYILGTLQTTYGLGDITTSILNHRDVGYADMGYHFPFHVGPPIEYSLQIYVVGHGTVEPNAVPEVHYFPPGTMVDLRATPDDGYRVRRWSGTNDDSLVGVINSVTMYTSRVVFVEFELAVPRVLNVATDGRYTYLGLQEAIDDAKDGDIIVLHSGTYAGTGYEVIGKNITITGTNPDDPNVVASTIIDCTNELNGGIHILGAPGGSTVLNGITIMNAQSDLLDAPGPQDPGDPGFDGEAGVPYVYMDTTDDGMFTGSATLYYAYSGLTVFGNHIISNCIIRDCSIEAGNGSGGNAGGEEGQDGGAGGNGGSAVGAGIFIGNYTTYSYEYIEDPNDPNYWIDYEMVLLEWGGSPLIINCTIGSCVVTAGNGANGGNGANRATGGRGGLSGRALGGGIYCDAGTSPTFIACTVTNCQAIAGNGGNGGDGGNPGLGGYGGLSHMDPCQPDPDIFSAYGGGVYCGIGSEPTFIDCMLNNNVTEGSVSGVGGISHPSGIQEQPRRNYNIPSYGAGVYCDSACSAKFESCHLEGNRTSYHNAEFSGYGGGLCLNGSEELYEDYYYYDVYYSPYIYYPDYFYDGGASGKISATLTDCNFVDNSASIGGGVYAVKSAVTIADCNLAGNISYVGGGLCCTESVAIISGCTVQNNSVSAAADPNVVYDPNNANDPNALRFGAGGGIYVCLTDTLIRDCNITHNFASGSGGGVYLFADMNAPQIINNLITNNSAGRDGGGISVNWSSNPTIANCTFVGNAAPGLFGAARDSGFGGGLFCSYESDCTVTDSIFWGNFGLVGSEMAVGTGFEYDPRCATLDVYYTDVRPSPNSVWVDEGFQKTRSSYWDRWVITISVKGLWASPPRPRIAPVSMRAAILPAVCV